MENQGKRRGRPLKEFDGNMVAERRRQRVRRAQNTFRTRQQIQVASAEQRIRALGDIVEKMSLEHSRLTERLLKCDTVTKSREAVSQLRQSLNTFRDLAQVATWNEEAYHDTNTFQVTQPDFDQGPTIGIGVVDPDVSSLDPAWPVLHQRYFGESWLSYGPWTIAPRVAPPSVMSQLHTQEVRDFGLDVLRSSLQIAYAALLNHSVEFPFDVAQSMFRYALKDFTKEELSFIIRWYLGPGVSELACLGFATSSFDPSYEVAGKPTIQSLPHQSNSVKTGSYTPYFPEFAEEYVSAFEMSRYLQTLGAFDFDIQTISMTTGHPDLHTTLDCRQPRRGNNHGCPSKLQGAQIEPTRFYTMFNFNSFFGDVSSTTAVPTPLGGSQSDRRHVITVSTPKFLQELALVSVCLGHGPAFSRRAIPTALMASVISTREL
ncbi:hypothetical protein BCR34DRAFT_585063 [Clohesyomyces aquaticus]|uniref:BZIP domain-containing protein n=1 Tax=Clohesyomyces aquaticus TaxID=1231657 RepID=A0A1Y1ZYU1_9PLEO|nr:hypothetical protein BCR34DRAFT_585063 [Clohesyomyces aquaticus]